MYNICEPLCTTYVQHSTAYVQQYVQQRIHQRRGCARYFDCPHARAPDGLLLLTAGTTGRWALDDFDSSRDDPIFASPPSTTVTVKGASPSRGPTYLSTKLITDLPTYQICGTIELILT